MKTIYETYVKEICSICKNKETELCEIRKLIDNSVKCKKYEKKENKEGYKDFKKRKAKQRKQVMKIYKK